MYIPKPNAMENEAIRTFVASTSVASFVTMDSEGCPEATLLPIVWTDSTVVAHMARANAQWRHLEANAQCLLIVNGLDAYISPSWQPSKAEHGRVAPTWNYETVLIRGAAVVHHDPSWLLNAVSDLTDQHEATLAEPWRVDDTPATFLAGQLKGIVGIEITVGDVRAKAKLSQGRTAADHAGIVRGLRSTGAERDRAIADAMELRRKRV
jgi:transcriptional regulator